MGTSHFLILKKEVSSSRRILGTEEALPSLPWVSAQWAGVPTILGRAYHSWSRGSGTEVDRPLGARLENGGRIPTQGPPTV
jgi:hypothetical protein